MTRGSRGGGGRGGDGGSSATRDPTAVVREAVGGGVGDDDIAAALSEAGGDVNEAVARLVDSESYVIVLAVGGTGRIRLGGWENGTGRERETHATTAGKKLDRWCRSPLMPRR